MSHKAAYEELRMLIDLLKDGVITREDFDGRKGELLRHVETLPQREVHAAMVESPEQVVRPSRGFAFSVMTVACFSAFCVLACIVLFDGNRSPDTAPVTVSANRLVATFQSNRQAARQDYGHRKITLIGFLDVPARHEDDRNSLDIAAYDLDRRDLNHIDTVKVALSEDALSDAPTLNSGALVQVTCTRGMMGFETPHLGSCGDLRVLSRSTVEGTLKYEDILRGESGTAVDGTVS